MKQQCQVFVEEEGSVIAAQEVIEAEAETNPEGHDRIDSMPPE